MGQSIDPGGFADLKVVQISATEWRVSKRFLEENDPRSFSGIICECGDAYTVTRPGRPTHPDTYSSFDKALASLL